MTIETHNIETRNQEQKDASNPKQSIWVSAHAGSGKTFILIDRLTRLLLNDVPMEKILAITFTKAAASEMSIRLYERLGKWTLCSNEELTAELTALEGAPPSKEKLEKARMLFSRTLEKQEQSHIQTIHSFCQSVLKRFPMEARIYPNFQVIDDYAQNALLKEAQFNVLNNNQFDREAMKVITQNIESSVFEKIFSEIISHKRKIEIMLEDYSKNLERLAQEWHVPRNSSADTIREKILSARPKNIEKELKDNKKITFLDDYINIFLTQKLEPRKKLADSLRAEQARVFDLVEKANLLNAFQFTHAVLQVADAFLKEFSRLKAQKGFLDYDDLIHKTLDLFQTHEAGLWVLYRLDGGIDHVLIDEAQDTNKEQWQLIEKLTEEFFAGQSYKEQDCSLFVVGDAKQSIFSFQGAEPDGFAKWQAHFARRAQEAQKPFRAIDLTYSFRAAPQLLKLVDKMLEGLSLSQEKMALVPHQAHHAEMPSHIEIWQPFTSEKDEKPEADEQLVEAIATKINTLLKDKENKAEDILILLRRRNAFVDTLIRSLKKHGLPVAGSDRLVLAQELVIQDLLSLAKWVLLPQDDLALAEVLKSPLCALNESQLMSLAIGRGDISLWQSLSVQRNEFFEIFDFLSNCLRHADFTTPFDFFSNLLEVENKRSHFVALLGTDVHDPLDAFLNLTLNYEANHTPSLQGFVEWFSNTEAKIKRDMERGLNEVRLITIHSAKGLEAKIVFFIDIPASSPSNYFLPINEVPFFKSSAPSTSHLQEVKDKIKTQEGYEESRLLYVALTRAKEQLYICSYKKPFHKPSWFDTIAQQADKNLIVPHHKTEATSIEKVKEQKPAASKSTPPRKTTLPAFLTEKLVLTKQTKTQLNPSTLWANEKDKTITSPLKPPPQQSAAMRGTLIHEALRRGTKLKRDALIQYLQERFSTAATDKEYQALADEALALIKNKTFAEIFTPATKQTLDEVPLQANFGNTTLSGKIDRLLLDPQAKEAIIIDYKSDSRARDHDTIPDAYQAQLAAYALMFGKAFPDFHLKTGILWTSIPRLDWLDKKTLENQKKTLISKIEDHNHKGENDDASNH